VGRPYLRTYPLELRVAAFDDTVVLGGNVPLECGNHII
jgi:hypothetical protein